MSNLGGYRTAVVVLKNLGGPKKAVAILAGTTIVAGYGALRTVEAQVRRGIRAYRAARDSRNTPAHHFTTSGTDDSSGLSYRAGDPYLVLGHDSDNVLIETADGPYTLSAKLLARDSDYTAPDGPH